MPYINKTCRQILSFVLLGMLTAVFLSSCGGGGDDGGDDTITMLLPTNPPDGPTDPPDTSPDPASPPNLDISTFSVGNNSPTPGQSFTIRATVRNTGGDTTESTTLRYYRSTSSPINRSDMAVGTAAIGALSAGSSSSQTMNLQAPAATGTYYYGACIDTIQGEADTGNDCTSNRETARVIVAIVDVNLDVQNFTIDNFSGGGGGTLATGQRVRLRAVVRNYGPATAQRTTLTWYESTNSDITSRDNELGTDSVVSLSSGRTSAESLLIHLPGRAGTVHYGACVNDVFGETDARDNCTNASEAIAITVINNAGSIKSQVDDQCNEDNTDVRYRAFWLNNGVIIGSLVNEGITNIDPFFFDPVVENSCRINADSVADRICLGGQKQRDDGTVFGVGLDGSGDCTDCCMTCEAGEINTAGFFLQCFGGINIK